jgi:hypothetical protein
LSHASSLRVNILHERLIHGTFTEHHLHQVGFDLFQ